jgi:hypothetical protein
MTYLKVFYPDGLAPECGESNASDLSERWLLVCSDILQNLGPVFRRDMGSTLAHFEIEVGGPVGALYAYKQLCFSFAVSSGLGTEQDLGAVSWFRDLYTKSCASLSATPVCEALEAIEVSRAAPSILLLDHIQTDVPDEQKGALLELGHHFGVSLLRYLSE